MARKTKPKPLNTTQLAVLRHACRRQGTIISDGSTAAALVARGYAYETPHGKFLITLAGMERAKRKADCVSPTAATPPDPALLEDLK